jgi:hypothetical protein
MRGSALVLGGCSFADVGIFLSFPISQISLISRFPHRRWVVGNVVSSHVRVYRRTPISLSVLVNQFESEVASYDLATRLLAAGDEGPGGSGGGKGAGKEAKGTKPDVVKATSSGKVKGEMH